MMKTTTPTELAAILDAHKRWLTGENGGAQANLSRANLSRAGLSYANLSGADLSGADLSEANLSGANLSGADLSGADLSGANLSGADLSGADLSGADLSGADLSGADLSGADLSGANLREANLSLADLSEANLSGANLSGADLGGADLSGAGLGGADLSEANLSGANLSGANLSGAKGLRLARAFMAQFTTDADGVIVFKAFGGTDYTPPESWKIEPGAVLEEVVNPLPTINCGCGVNFGTEEWVRKAYPNSTIWRCRIEWLDLADVVVPYNTDGKARCGRLRLIEAVCPSPGK
jgi:hypothetical protein